jgi:hypothetical protein
MKRSTSLPDTSAVTSMAKRVMPTTKGIAVGGSIRSATGAPR